MRHFLRFHYIFMRDFSSLRYTFMRDFSCFHHIFMRRQAGFSGMGKGCSVPCCRQFSAGQAKEWQSGSNRKSGFDGS